MGNRRHHIFPNPGTPRSPNRRNKGCPTIVHPGPGSKRASAVFWRPRGTMTPPPHLARRSAEHRGADATCGNGLGGRRSEAYHSLEGAERACAREPRASSPRPTTARDHLQAGAQSLARSASTPFSRARGPGGTSALATPRRDASSRAVRGRPSRRCCVASASKKASHASPR